MALLRSIYARTSLREYAHMAEWVRRDDDPAQVLTEKEAAALLSIHTATLRRMPDGPPKMQVSEKRIGYRRGDLLAWQRDRISPARTSAEEAAA
jgi:hypothetical protein